jgi:hypothetical protein
VVWRALVWKAESRLGPPTPKKKRTHSPTEATIARSSVNEPTLPFYTT